MPNKDKAKIVCNVRGCIQNISAELSRKTKELIRRSVKPLTQRDRMRLHTIYKMKMREVRKLLEDMETGLERKKESDLARLLEKLNELYAEVCIISTEKDMERLYRRSRELVDEVGKFVHIDPHDLGGRTDFGGWYDVL